MQFVSIATKTSNWIKILSMWNFFRSKKRFSFPGKSLIEHEIAEQRELKFHWFDKRKSRNDSSTDDFHFEFESRKFQRFFPASFQ